MGEEVGLVVEGRLIHGCSVNATSRPLGRTVCEIGELGCASHRIPASLGKYLQRSRLGSRLTSAQLLDETGTRGETSLT